jgi:Flp pilus assembly protein TadG
LLSKDAERNSAWGRMMKTQIDFDGITRSLRRAVNLAVTEAQAETRSPKRRALLRSGEQGQTLVEFALVLPAMLAVITATFTIGIAFYTQMTLNSAVSAAAQDVQTIRLTTSDLCGDALTAIEAAGPSLRAANIGLTVTINGTAEAGHTCTGATSTLAAAQGEPVTVAATYPCLLSIISPGYGTHFISNCQLSAKATVYEY